MMQRNGVRSLLRYLPQVNSSKVSSLNVKTSFHFIERKTMKRAAVVIAAGIAAALFQSTAYSQDAKKAEALAKQSGCLNCHAVDTKKAGPSFKDIAAKNKAAGAAKLMASLKGKP